MKISRYLILLLSYFFFIFSILSCKNDSSSIDNSTQRDTTIDILAQNELDPGIQLNDDVPDSEVTGSESIGRDERDNNMQEKSDQNKKSVKKPRASDEIILASVEFKTFMEAVIKLSNESTSEELNYVNSFMADNGLWKKMHGDQCNLLKIDKIKSDQIVLNFWEKRCNFNRAQNTVVNKFNISYDALGKLMQQKRNESQ